jgi:MOSC domain-containing protein YiiM
VAVEPRLAAVFVGQPQIHDENGHSWLTSIVKSAVTGAIALGDRNLEGDQQADPTVHGGPEKAVCVYPVAHYARWRAELERDDCAAGWCGENFAVEGQVEVDVAIGDVFAVGTAVVQVSQPRGPCWKLARRWQQPDLVKRAVSTGRTGWYLRVLRAGTVAAGDVLHLVDRPFPDWTVARVNDAAYRPGGSAADRRALAACTSLAQPWRDAFARKTR